MPAITSGTVLVTGANGFIAGWIVKNLLENGFSVRGTVRSAKKVDALKALFAEHANRLEFAIVEDIATDGAFDDAVKGVDAIVHTASPIDLALQEPKAFVGPAVRGTTGILKSVQAHGSSVKRIVTISSVGAVCSLTDYPSGDGKPVRVFTEADWNDEDIAALEKQGKDADVSTKYRASKALAENAAWKFYNDEKAKGVAAWDLGTLCPPWVFGPALGAKAPEELGLSVGYWFQHTVKQSKLYPDSMKASWVDVRDVATAVRLSLMKESAGGERFIVASGPFVWYEWVSIVSRLLGQADSAEQPKNTVFEYAFDAKKSREVLGITYKSKEETAAYMLDDFKAKGWL